MHAVTVRSSTTRVLAAMLVVIAAAVPGTARPAQVDALFTPSTGKSKPGAAVLVLQSGRVLLRKAYGMANLEHGVPNTPETKLRVGSLTKCFTAVAVLQLVEAGKLHLDTPIGVYLPATPDGDRMTLRHLLTHTSGLPSAGSGPLEFTPGEMISYSNAGYKLLGKVVEAVSGQSWEAYVQSHILDPAGLRDTGCDHAEQILSGRASGYLFDGRSGYLNTPLEDIAKTAGAAGALYSTVDDLARFAEALSAGRLLRADTLEQAFTPNRLIDGTATKYGFGWMIASYRGVREIGHGGDTEGQNAFLAVYPDPKLTVIVLSNVCMRPPGPLPSALKLGRSIAAIYAGDAMQPETAPRELALPAAQLHSFAGRYRLGGRKDTGDASGGDTITVTVQEGRLIAFNSANRLELCAESENAFYARSDPETKVRFLRDASGQVAGLVVRVMDLVELRGTRLPGPSPPPTSGR